MSGDEPVDGQSNAATPRLQGSAKKRAFYIITLTTIAFDVGWRGLPKGKLGKRWQILAGWGSPLTTWAVKVESFFSAATNNAESEMKNHHQHHHHPSSPCNKVLALSGHLGPGVCGED